MSTDDREDLPVAVSGASLAAYALEEIEVEAAVVALAEEASFSAAAMNSVN